jgi:peptidoglycan/LPS O-acetylase OafA/YrhL
MQRYHTLDIVRGLAALSVLLSHWGGWTLPYASAVSTQVIVSYQNIFQILFWGGGGIHPGVIVFIVLSGFCIHLPQAIDARKLTQPEFWKVFAVRRSRRILPVYWAALLIGIVSLWVTGPAYMGEKGQVVNSDLFFSIFGVSEIIRVFGITALYPGNGPLATVAVEMLLYASYPLFLFIHRRCGLHALIGFGLVMYFGVALARLIGIDTNRLHGTYFEFLIYWIIGAVSAGAYATQNINRSGIPLRLGMMITAGYFLYLALITYVKVKGFHVVTTLLLAFLTGVALISLLALESQFNQKQSRITGIMAALGARSYSLYVVHTPVIFTSLWFFNTHTKLQIVSYPPLALIAVFISTEVLFRLVERPSHHYARQFQ